MTTVTVVTVTVVTATLVTVTMVSVGMTAVTMITASPNGATLQQELTKQGVVELRREERLLPAQVKPFTVPQLFPGPESPTALRTFCTNGWLAHRALLVGRDNVCR